MITCISSLNFGQALRSGTHPLQDFNDFFVQEDADNPQLVVEYVMDIYKYLRFLEKQQFVKDDYLAGQQVSLTTVLVLQLDGYYLSNHFTRT